MATSLSLLVLIGLCCIVVGLFGGMVSVWVAIQFVEKFKSESLQVTAPQSVREKIPNDSQNDSSVTYLTSAHEEKILESAAMDVQKERFSDGLD